MTTRPRVKSFCIDIDGTLTQGTGTGHPFTDGSIGYIWGIIADELSRKESIPYKEAAARVQQATDEIQWWDYPHVAGYFGIDHWRVWRRVLQIQDEVLVPFDDGIRMTKELKNRGFSLYITSNNPNFGCLLKLARAGLADITGTKWFDRILGANLCRGQKSQSGHWFKVLAQANLDPKLTVSVGDNAVEDGDVPIGAGFAFAVLVNHKQRKDVVVDGQKFIVNSLELVPDLFELES